jgi:hypothetical protein
MEGSGLILFDACLGSGAANPMRLFDLLLNTVILLIVVLVRSLASGVASFGLLLASLDLSLTSFGLLPVSAWSAANPIALLLSSLGLILILLGLLLVSMILLLPDCSVVNLV